MKTKMKMKTKEKDLFKALCSFSGMVLACLVSQCQASAYSDGG